MPSSMANVVEIWSMFLMCHVAKKKQEKYRLISLVKTTLFLLFSSTWNLFFFMFTTIVEWCCEESDCILFFCRLEYGTTFESMREWEALCKVIMKMRWYFVRPFLTTFPTASSLVDVFHFTGPALNDESFLRTPRCLPRWNTNLR